MRNNWQLLLITVYLLACCACGSTKPNSSSNPALDEHGNADPGRMAAAVEILPGGMYKSLDPDSLAIEWSGQNGNLLATISTTNVLDLRAAYLRLTVPESFSGNPLLVPGDWAGEDALSLAVKSSDNSVDIGICVLHPDEATGFSGSGSLAVIEFSDRASEPMRTASAPPVSQASQINFGYDPYRNNFAWFYRNQGDYDQNGEVSISDLTPIAVHFGKTASGGFPVHTVESVVDGDGNGEINIADISPIGIGFGSRVDSFNIYKGLQADYPAGPTEASTIAKLQSVLLTDALNTPADGRLYFDVDNSEGVDSAPAYWLRPLDNGTEGIPSDISGLGNMPPTASFTIAENAGLAPFNLQADASGSSDPEGGELEYFWFVVETGLFIAEFDNPGEVLLNQSVQAGSWSVVLYVRDEDGAMAFAVRQFGVAAAPGWQTVDFDIRVPGGETVVEIEDIALRGIDERPYIAVVYETASESVVALNYGSDPLWNQLLDFRRINDMPGGRGGQVDILDVGGVPGVVSMQTDFSDYIVEYNYVEDQVFTSPYNIAMSADTLRDISAVTVEDKPSVVIFDRSNGDLLQAVSDDAIGSQWSTAQVFISGNNLGWGVSAGLIGGAPAIIYGDNDNGETRFADSHIDNGNVIWHVPFKVHETFFSDIGDSVLDIPDGGQWLMLHDYLTGSLLGMRDSGFSTQGEISATGGDSHTEYSTAVIGDQVCVAFVDDAKLKFIRSTDGSATAWQPVQEITPLTVEDGWISLAEVGGFPAIAYVDELTTTAHYAILVE